MKKTRGFERERVLLLLNANLPTRLKGARQPLKLWLVLYTGQIFLKRILILNLNITLLIIKL